MRGGPCAAGPSVKLGPWRCNQSNWSYCATSSRLNKTAAEGKSAQPFWSCPAGGRGRGDEQWGRLGDARRAAVLLCPKGGDVKAPPTACIARGPDGTKGFVLRRARRAGGGVQHREAKAMKGTEVLREVLRSDFALGLVGTFFVVLFVVSFPWLGAAALMFFVLDSVGQLKPEVTHFVAAILELAGGLVLVLWIADWGLVASSVAFRLVCAGGVPFAGAIFLAIAAGEYLLRRSLGAEATPMLGVEEEGDEEEKEDSDVPSGTRVYPVSPPGAKVATSSAAAAEAGRLRRRASACRQYKVFDPGRNR